MNARLDRGWTQEQAAERAGVSPVTYNRAENGVAIHPSTGKQIANALGLVLSECRIPVVESDQGGTECVSERL